MSHTKPANPPPESSQDNDEVTLAAMAWAEFLYEEYMREKHKQLLLSQQDTTMELNNEG